MIALALAALLMVQDPVLDAHGDGSLLAPSAAAYRSASAYDLESVALLDTPFATFALTLGSLPNPFALQNGFSLTILELYWHVQAEGERAASQALLPGSGMRLPEGEGWHYALRLTGDAARLYRAEGPGEWLELAPPHLSAEGDTLTVATSLTRPSAFRLYAMLGSYTPFSADGWQPISPAPSPWAFSSATQTRPVVDVLADSQDLQAQAIRTGVLPATVVQSAPLERARVDPWSLLMLMGSLTVLVGLVGRLLVKPTPRPAPSRGRRAAAAPQAEVVLPTVAAYPGLDLDAPGAPDSPEDAFLEDAFLEDVRLDPTLLDPTFLDTALLDPTFLDTALLDTARLPDAPLDDAPLDDAPLDDPFLDDVPEAEAPAGEALPTAAPHVDPAHDAPTSREIPLEPEAAALDAAPAEPEPDAPADTASSPRPDPPTNAAQAVPKRLTLDRDDWLEPEDDPLDDDWERGDPKTRA